MVLYLACVGPEEQGVTMKWKTPASNTTLLHDEGEREWKTGGREIFAAGTFFTFCLFSLSIFSRYMYFFPYDEMQASN